MTPKEKAKELYFKMHSQEHIISKEAKHCALIAVDEILKVTEHESPSSYVYYQKVKQELQKL